MMLERVSQSKVSKSGVISPQKLWGNPLLLSRLFALIDAATALFPKLADHLR
jgi:hypothetical protein